MHGVLAQTVVSKRTSGACTPARATAGVILPPSLAPALSTFGHRDAAAESGPELNLTLTAPIGTWDEALPLGNGLMGGLLWGGDSTLRRSLASRRGA